MSLVLDSHERGTRALKNKTEDMTQHTTQMRDRMQDIDDNAQAAQAAFVSNAFSSLERRAYNDLVNEYRIVSQWLSVDSHDRALLRERKDLARHRAEQTDMPSMSMTRESIAIVNSIHTACNRTIRPRPLPFNSSDIDTPTPGRTRSGVGTSQNIVVDEIEYNRIANHMLQRDNMLGQRAYNVALAIDRMCDTTYIMPKAVPEIKRITGTFKGMLNEGQAISEQFAGQTKRYANDMVHIGEAQARSASATSRPVKTHPPSTFVWDEIDAEEIRRMSRDAMKRTTEDMRETALVFTQQLTRLKPYIQRLAERIAKLHDKASEIAAQPTAMHYAPSCTYPYEEIWTVDTGTMLGRQTQIDRYIAQAREVQEQMQPLQELADKLRESAQTLNETADELDYMTERAEQLFRDLHSEAMDTDAAGSRAMQEKIAQIEDYIRRMGELRDSVGQSFTSEADGKMYFGSSNRSIVNDLMKRAESHFDVLNIFSKSLEMDLFQLEANSSPFPPMVWGAIEYYLSRDFEALAREQPIDPIFSMLARYFGKMAAPGGYVGDLERFINLMLVPTSMSIQGRNPQFGWVNVPTQNGIPVTGYQLCPLRSGKILSHLRQQAEDLLIRQLQYRQDGFNHRHLDPFRQNIQRNYGILSSLVKASDAGNVFIGIGGNPLSFNMNGNRVNVTFHYGQINSSRGVVELRPGLGNPSHLRRIEISPSHTALLGDLLRISGQRFELNHQFNLFDALVKKGIDSLIGAVPYIGSWINKVRDAAGIVTNNRNQCGVIRDQRRMIYYATLAQYHLFFAIEGVIITDTNNQNIPIQAWPTALTPESIAALYIVLNDIHGNRIPNELTNRSIYDIFLQIMRNSSHENQLWEQIEYNRGAAHSSINPPSAQDLEPLPQSPPPLPSTPPNPQPPTEPPTTPTTPPPPGVTPPPTPTTPTEPPIPQPPTDPPTPPTAAPPR